uniref:Aldehyde dehydrogenase domain-containing protein n=1 Tax=Leptobrachium leishanense TaxID=445787 RepID=A0A8C5QQ48_9ANUR
MSRRAACPARPGRTGPPGARRCARAAACGRVRAAPRCLRRGLRWRPVRLSKASDGAMPGRRPCSTNRCATSATWHRPSPASGEQLPSALGRGGNVLLVQGEPLALGMTGVELTELLPVLGEAATPSPRGRCLIIGPWNYPLNTVLGPLVSAVAAGNTAIVKPSEFHAPTEVAVVEGGVATATRLLALPFDHIFFTGSPAVGQVVMAALGGKSPAIVDASADLPAAARMLAWGKLANAGQTCVAPDHVLVHRSVAARFAECWREAVARTTGAARTRWPPAPTSGHGEHAHAARVAELVDDALARDARIEAEEIFGPVMPLRTFDTLDEAIARANAAPKPRRSTSSQYAHANLPFGGRERAPGWASAHGWHGFRAFSHERACLADGPLNGLRLLFPPNTRARLALARLLHVLPGQ